MIQDDWTIDYDDEDTTMIFPDWLGSYGGEGVEVLFGGEISVDLTEEDIEVSMDSGIEVDMSESQIEIEVEI